MQINDFKSIVGTFIDPGSEMLVDNKQIMIQVNDELIEASISAKGGDIYVDEEGKKNPASKWISTRLAKLPILATRLRDSVASTKYFISPSASHLPTLALGPNERLVNSEDALSLTLDTLNETSPLETMVLYITSDAGEGKTSLINQIALKQASLFLENKSEWLLVPIPLGGRHFMRFDDITIGALQNRYRFQFLYYQSFLALVRMGVIIPAFDGFEEMFVESSTGEALSAMGILVESLGSQGSMVVAARKAYFEFENLRAQERLFDTIRTNSVGFCKIELERWNKTQFIQYCEKRNIDEAKELYSRASERLGADHALLTRAVLVRRLVDIAVKSQSPDSFLEQLSKAGANFFSVFVCRLIEREANEKWIDRSGEKDVGAPLLSVKEHCELLSLIALSMWESKIDYLTRDNIEFVTDYFSESSKKNAFQSQQIRERIRGHAMLVPSLNALQAVEFDHEEFRLFFLGEGIANQILPLTDRAKVEILGIFRRGILPKPAQHSLIQAMLRETNTDPLEVVRFLISISGMDVQASYTQENCSDIVIRILSGMSCDGLNICEQTFGTDALRDRKLTGIVFNDCYFQPSSFDLTEIIDCSFVNCNFSQMRVFSSTKLNNVSFDSCEVDSLLLSNKEREYWDPLEIRYQLTKLGISFVGGNNSNPDEGVDLTIEVDLELRDMEKIIRYFMRSTHISESVIRMKLGVRGQGFLDRTIPKLIHHEIMEEIDNRSGSIQKRFKLNVTLQSINKSIASAKGSFELFLNQINTIE